MRAVYKGHYYVVNSEWSLVLKVKKLRREIRTTILHINDAVKVSYIFPWLFLGEVILNAN